MTKESTSVADLKSRDPEPKAPTIRDLIAQHSDQIKAALPKHLTADRMARLATTAIRRVPKLQEADPISLFGAVITCAQYGLEPGINAHLVPFFNKNTKRYEVQFLPDYRGIMDLARRSGDVTKIVARVVREGDHFDAALGTAEYIRHVPMGDGTAPITHAYAVAYVDGEPQVEIMTRAQVEAVRDRSKAKDDGPWVTDFGEMARKTVVKRLCKYLPMSIEYREVAALDDHAESGISQDMGAVITGEFEREE